MGLAGALLHTLNHAIFKALLFFGAGNAYLYAHTGGLMTRLPWTGFAFALAFFYVVGTPPSGFFFSELLMLQGMVHARDWLVLGVFLVLLMIIFIGMSRAVLHMLQNPRPSEAPISEPRERFDLARGELLCFGGFGADRYFST
ncbi:MAG: hypothetical protein JO151_09200 [Verrucomicrobia bacterium]|nr:hypothetical protein [Verrucomicrobiota bacterium]